MAEPYRPNPWRQIARKALVAVLPRRRFLASGPTSDGAVCLTFDDGPHPEHTPRLLDVLAAQGIHATFFVVGARAAAHPEIVRRVVAEGHAIGHHSYHHREPRETTADELLAEVEDSVRNLTIACRTQTTTVATPGGCSAGLPGLKLLLASALPLISALSLLPVEEDSIGWSVF